MNPDWCSLERHKIKDTKSKSKVKKNIGFTFACLQSSFTLNKLTINECQDTQNKRKRKKKPQK